MVSKTVNFRLGDDAFDILIRKALEMETSTSKAAQMLLTELLTGRKDELGLGPGGSPPRPENIITKQNAPIKAVPNPSPRIRNRYKR